MPANVSENNRQSITQPQNAKTPDALSEERSEGPVIAGHQSIGAGLQCGNQDRNIRRIGQFHRLRMLERRTTCFLHRDDQGGGGFKPLKGTVRTLRTQVAPRLVECILQGQQFAAACSRQRQEIMRGTRGGIAGKKLDVGIQKESQRRSARPMG